MKIRTIVSFLLAVMMVSSGFAFADGIDWASMDTDTIQAEIANAKAELDKRNSEGKEGGSFENTLIGEYNGILISATGFEVEDFGTMGTVLKIPYIAENYSDLDVKNMFMEQPSINGWEVMGAGGIDVKPGEKAKGNLRLKLADAEISTMEEIETVVLRFYFWDDSIQSWGRTEPVTINF